MISNDFALACEGAPKKNESYSITMDTAYRVRLLAVRFGFLTEGLPSTSRFRCMIYKHGLARLVFLCMIAMPLGSLFQIF